TRKEQRDRDRMVYRVKNPQSLYINGKWVAVAPGSVEEVINPATEEVIGLAPCGNVEHADAAISAARTAFDSGQWRRLAMRERVAVLNRFLDAIVARQNEIVELIVAEVGSPSARAPFHIKATVGYAR